MPIKIEEIKFFIYKCQPGSLIKKIEINDNVLSIYPDIAAMAYESRVLNFLFYPYKKFPNLPKGSSVQENSLEHKNLQLHTVSNALEQNHFHYKFNQTIDEEIFNNILARIEDYQNDKILRKKNADKYESSFFYKLFNKLGILSDRISAIDTTSDFMNEKDINNIKVAFNDPFSTVYSQDCGFEKSCNPYTNPFLKPTALDQCPGKELVFLNHPSQLSLLSSNDIDAPLSSTFFVALFAPQIMLLGLIAYCCLYKSNAEPQTEAPKLQFRK